MLEPSVLDSIGDREHIGHLQQQSASEVPDPAERLFRDMVIKELAECRKERTREVLSSLAVRMKEFENDLRSEEATLSSLFETALRSDNRFAALEGLGIRSMSDVVAQYQITRERMIERFKECAERMNFEFGLAQDKAIASISGAQSGLSHVKDLIAIQDAQGQSKCAVDCERRLRETKARSVETLTKLTEFDTECRGSLERRLQSLRQSFSTEWEPERSAYQNLQARHDIEAAKLTDQRSSLNKLKAEVEKLKLRQSRMLQVSGLIGEKQRALEYVSSLKSKIHFENNCHADRLGQLAVLFDGAKSKIEKELDLVHQISRVWEQCSRRGISVATQSHGRDVVQRLKAEVTKYTIRRINGSSD